MRSTHSSAEAAPKYPSLLFSEALTRIGDFDRNSGGMAANRQQAFVHLGYKAKNGAAARTMNALTRYGLLERSSGAYRVSDLARRILDPRSPQDAWEARREAAWKPEVFRLLRERFGLAPGQDDEIKRYLESVGLPDPGRRRLLTVFRDVVGVHGQVGEPPAADRSNAAFTRDSRLFAYRMNSGAEIAVELRGEAEIDGVLRILSAWIALKREEIADLGGHGGKSDGKARPRTRTQA